MGVDPSKRNAYRVIEDGLIVLDPAAIAEVQIPTKEVRTDEHVEDNHTRETPSVVHVNEFSILLYENQASGNDWWLTNLPYDQETGALKSTVEGTVDIIIQQLAWDHETVIREWTCKGCLLKNSAFERSSKREAGNQIRTITMKPWKCIERNMLAA